MNLLQASNSHRQSLMNDASVSRARKESGFILIASLLMLLVLSILAISMYRGFSEQEKMSANAKEKARAFQVAQSTLQYAEFQLVQGNFTNAACSSTTPPAVITACLSTSPTVNISPPTASNPLLTLVNGYTYSPMNPTMAISTAGGAGTYYALPQFYIQFLGLSAPNQDGQQSQLYQVTALGYGGNANADAVVQSTYQLTPSVVNIGGP